jgi:hypothetical protein
MQHTIDIHKGVIAMSDSAIGFNPMPKRLVDIFKHQADTNYFFKIPVFQREFSWGKNEITKLLDQISTSGPNGHFIGTIFTCSNGSHEEVIDGQQRLTCLSLTILALCKYIKTSPFNKKLNDIVDTELVNFLYIKSNSMSSPDYSTTDNSKVRLKLIPGTQSKNHIDYVMLLNEYIELKAKLSSDEIQQTNYYRNRKMYKSYAIVSEWITKNLANENDIETFINQLVSTRFVLLRTTTSNDAADLFDGLNSTGLHLSVSDIVKNKVLGNYYANSSRVFSSMNLQGANDLWEKFNDNIEFRNQTQYLKHLYYTLNYVVNSMTGSDDDFPTQPVAEKGLPDLYDVLIRRAKASDIVIRTIRDESEVYKVLLNPQPQWTDLDDKLNRALFELNVIGAQPALSLILFLEHQKYQLDQRIILIQELGKIFARQHVMGLPKISFLDLIMVKTINILSKRDLSRITAADIMDMIINYRKYWTSSATTNTLTPQTELLQVLKGSLYDTNRDITRYLLIKLANHLHLRTALYTRDQFHAFMTYEAFRSQGRRKLYSIEHIMPQNEDLSPEWIESLRSGSNNQIDPKVIHGQYLHMLGNLTLTADNSNLGTRPFRQKQQLTHISIENVQYPIGYKNGDVLNSFTFNDHGDSLATATTWNADMISQRTEYMVKELIKVLTISIHGIDY